MTQHFGAVHTALRVSAVALVGARSVHAIAAPPDSQMLIVDRDEEAEHDRSADIP